MKNETIKTRRIPAAVILTVSLITSLALIFAAAETSRAGNSYRVGGMVRGLTGEHKVYVSIYTDEGNYKDGIAMKSIIIHPEKIKEGKAEYYFLIPEGEYMIMVFEDRNGDGKLNYGGVFNTPREPYGFYRRFRPFLNSPSFDRLKFKLDKEIRAANINLIKK
jgi:uncharacterized protein (DUF2141 family)